MGDPCSAEDFAKMLLQTLMSANFVTPALYRPVLGYESSDHFRFAWYDKSYSDARYQSEGASSWNWEEGTCLEQESILLGVVNGRFSSLPTTQSALQYKVIHPIHSHVHTLMAEASVQGAILLIRI